MPHLAEDEVLFDYAMGSLCEGRSLAVATHLWAANQCRETVRQFERIGGAMLVSAPSEPVSESCLESVLDQLDKSDSNADDDDSTAHQGPTGQGTATDPDIPPPLRSYLPASLDRLEWRRITNSLSVYDVPLGRDAGSSRVRLMRIASGAQMPRHSHEGEEYTVVLRGGYRDGDRDFLPGDIEVISGGMDHTPVAHEDGDCICLTVTTAPLRFTGRFGRLLSPFVRF